MSATHCPTCKEPLHLWPSFTGATCLFCINPHCSDNTEHPRLSPPPAPTSPGESIAAPAQVDQVGGTQSQLFEFKDWLVYYVSVSEDFLDEAEYELKHGAAGAKARVHALRKDISEAKAALKFACLFEEQSS